jgi:hypothetical protein
MRYLKYYESLNTTLEDFCTNYLAYLLDDGFSFELDHGKKYINVDFYRISGSSNFKWSDIKEHFIPFLAMLDKSYSVNSGVDFYLKEPECQGSQHRFINFMINKEDIINDIVDDITEEMETRNKYILTSPLKDCYIDYISININI